MEEPECYIDKNGNKIWYLPSKGEDCWHRLDGPAFEGANGSKEWWVDDKHHRLDGPAYEGVYGSKEWWVDGEQLSSDEIEAWLSENNIDLSTDEGQMAFRLRWS